MQKRHASGPARAGPLHSLQLEKYYTATYLQERMAELKQIWGLQEEVLVLYRLVAVAAFQQFNQEVHLNAPASPRKACESYAVCTYTLSK